MKKNYRHIASIILVAVTAGFLVGTAFNHTFWGRMLAAMFGAAMIGGIADWFGIIALFKKPLGIPFKTEIIPRNRQKLVDSLVYMVSSRRELIISIPDLSHHRTYRSVYGGSNRN